MEMPITVNHLVKNLWHNIYDSLMFAGLKLSNREDSEIKKTLLYFTPTCTVHSECLELDVIFCTGACM